MRKKLLYLSVLILSGPTFASSTLGWVEIARSSDTIVYVAPSTIRSVGNYRQAWVRNEILNGIQNLRSMETLVEFDCNRMMKRNLRFRIEMLDGGTDQIEGDGEVKNDWYAEEQGSFGQAEIDFVCEFDRI